MSINNKNLLLQLLNYFTSSTKLNNFAHQTSLDKPT